MTLSNDIKKAIVITIITSIVGIGVYVAAGFVLYRDVVLYDQTPADFTPNVDSEWTFNVQVKDNSPVELPLINPSYVVNVTLRNTANSYAYFFTTGDVPMKFTDRNLDTGTIGSTNLANIPIILHFGNQSNLTLTVTTSLNYFGLFQVSSINYVVTSDGMNNFHIAKVP